MFATRQFFQACRITLFTRETCGLCAQAKGVLSNVWDQRPFVYKEIDVDKTEVKTWKELYDYDVPVVFSPSSFLHFFLHDAHEMQKDTYRKRLVPRRGPPKDWQGCQTHASLHP
jgi:glutaredoxin